jgi:hypothetical protein
MTHVLMRSQHRIVLAASFVFVARKAWTQGGHKKEEEQNEK